MGRIVVSAFLTADGVMQAPGGPDEDRDGDFHYGGWLFPFADEVMRQIITKAIQDADSFLLGRRTYEIFAGYWPNMTDPSRPDSAIAVELNAKPKLVASRTLSSVEWNNSALLQGDVVEALNRAKSETAGTILTQGSSNLIQTLINTDLVDEYLLFVFPVILGRGKRLFGEGAGVIPTRLKMVDTVTTSTGGQVMTYRADGRPEFGSIGD
jgi:dihydrofolate reductase